MIRVFLILLFAVSGCIESRAPADDEMEAVLDELALSVVSFEAQTFGGCSCRDYWIDENGDGIEDADEWHSGYEPPESWIRLVLRSDRLMTLKLRPVSGAIHHVGSGVSTPLSENQLPRATEWTFDGTNEQFTNLYMPTQLGEFELQPYGQTDDEWIWELRFEVIEADEPPRFLDLRTAPFMADPGLVG